MTICRARFWRRSSDDAIVVALLGRSVDPGGGGRQAAVSLRAG